LDGERTEWASGQRALARALGLSIDEWLLELEAAGGRRTGLTAAVIGAAVARRMGLSVLDRLDVAVLVREARSLIDPEPPRVENPVLKEAVRRATELDEGRGKKLLAKKRKAPEVTTPRRGDAPIGESSRARTPDAPGDDE
jgi:hypothetical protein